MKYRKKNYPLPKGPEVYWEKWIDPYNNPEIDQTNKEIQDVLEETSEFYNPEIEDYEQYNIDYEHDIGELQKYQQPLMTVMTNFGILPLIEQSLASSQFDFWTGHTSFPITRKHCRIISACDGVETLTPLTKYRFRIGVAKLFDEKTVMFNVRNALLKAIQHDKKTI